MGKQLDHITDRLKEFINKQKMFFVGTAAKDGTINVSPKGTDSFRIINKNRIVWLNLTGSGNETAAHLLRNNRMTIMFCAFKGNPLILRLYGNAKAYHEYDNEYQSYEELFETGPGARQIIVMQIDLVQTSCGFGVPLYEYVSERGTLKDWAEKKGRDGIKDYWRQKNTKSIDGFKTEIPIE